MDGRGAASIVYQYEKNHLGHEVCEDDFIEMDYARPFPEVVSPNERVYIVDYSFTKSTVSSLEHLLAVSGDVVWCDHHKSSIELTGKYPYLVERTKGYIQQDISGMALTYMYLFHKNFDECPQYIELVSDYDCWLKKYTDSDFFELGLTSRNYGPTDSVWEELFLEEVKGQNVEQTTDTLIHDGEIIKTYIDKDNEQYRNSFGFPAMIDGYHCYVVNKKANSWVFGDKINLYELCISYVYDGTKYNYTLFSSDSSNTDCSKIAEKFGGGGHKHVAGFTSNKIEFKTTATSQAYIVTSELTGMTSGKEKE
jgi:oligoribonuclease NrnB/cAMP/cGMP phosphodiesterase (DHH superfamily)